MEYIVNAMKAFFEFSKYILKFAILLVICWGLSIVIPLTCFEVSILMMFFWFLNLYNKR